MCRIILSCLFALICCSYAITAQSKRSNNPYAPSPSIESNISSIERVAVNVPTRTVATTTTREVKVQPSVSRDVKTTTPSGALTSIYKIGVGDILYVNIVNTSGASGYYTVRENGTIDFPIAGDNVVVGGRTTVSAAGTIARAINVYSNPQVEVKVSQYASHKVEVFGLVERSGEKCIQREAVPLYVIKAEAGVDPKATRVIVRRSSRAVDSFLLKDASSDDILITPGDSVEFAAG
jgi:protein involved in polysaccharide export with SLBB domain